MKICILETDTTGPAFEPVHGSYADMFSRWLAPVLPEARFTRVFVAEGEPVPEDLTAFDAFLVTGSRAGVYEDRPWIAPLIAGLQRIAAARVPLAGICFGHQVMAQAFGGEVRKSPDGWVVGRHDHDLSATGAAVFGPGALPALSIHQDQVMVPPPRAERLFSTAASPNGSFLYTDFPAISSQVHPEFTLDFLRALITPPDGVRLADDLHAAAMASLSGPLDQQRIARGFARVLRGEEIAHE